MNNSKVVRLNKTCLRCISEIRGYWLNGFKKSNLTPTKSLFTDAYIIQLALSNYCKELENDKGGF